MEIVAIAQIVNVVIPIIIFGTILGIIIYRVLNKKGLLKKKKKNKKEETDVRSVSQDSISNFNVVDDIRENYIITNGGLNFTAGLVVHGVSFDKLATIEKNIVEQNYIGLYNMVDWDMQYYIQSRLMDIDSNVKYLEESKEKIIEEQKNLLSQRSKVSAVIDSTPTRKEQYMLQLDNINAMLQRIQWQILHKEEEIAYAKAVASPQSQPQFDLYILITYQYDADAFSTELTEDEVFQKAKDDLETKLVNIIAVLKRCMVDSELLNREQIAEMLYRAYNLSDADIVKFKDMLKTSSFDLYTTTDYFKKSQLEYAANRIKESMGKNGEVA